MACECGDVVPKKAERRSTLRLALGLNASMFAIGIVAGYVADSTGMMADALDMGTDAVAYALALMAITRGQAFKQDTARWTGAVLILLGSGIVVEVTRRAFSVGVALKVRRRMRTASCTYRPRSFVSKERKRLSDECARRSAVSTREPLRRLLASVSGVQPHRASDVRLAYKLAADHDVDDCWGGVILVVPRWVSARHSQIILKRCLLDVEQNSGRRNLQVSDTRCWWNEKRANSIGDRGNDSQGDQRATPLVAARVCGARRRRQPQRSRSYELPDRSGLRLSDSGNVVLR